MGLGWGNYGTRECELTRKGALSSIFEPAFATLSPWMVGWEWLVIRGDVGRRRKCSVVIYER